MCDVDKWDGVSVPQMVTYKSHWCKKPSHYFDLADEQSGNFTYPDANDKTSSVYVPPPYVANLVTGWGNDKIVTEVRGEKSIGDMYKESGIHDNSLSQHNLQWKDGVAKDGLIIPAWTDFRRKCCSGENDPSICGSYVDGSTLCDEVRAAQTTNMVLIVLMFILVLLLATISFFTFIYGSKKQSNKSGDTEN